MNNSKLSPITIFGYDRPKHLNNLLESLVKNKESQDSTVYFYIDGKNKTTNIENYEKTIAVVEKDWGFKEKKVIIRDKNFGCRENIIGGVSEVLKKHKKTIILEDDLVLSKNFLDYMNNCLEIYKNKKNIWHINGYSHPKVFYSKSTTALSYTMYPWGWATWEDRWNIFIDGQYHEKNYISKKSPSMIKKFNVSNLYDFENIILKHQQGEGSIWDMYWYQCMFLNNGLSIFPSMSHVQNYGFDGTGLHCGENEEFNTKLNQNKTKKYIKKDTISYFYGLSYRLFLRKIKFKNYIDYHKDKFLSFNAFLNFLKKKLIG